MISLNGLYTTLREAIKELTNIEIYQNISHSYKVVDAKWLFVKVVYYLFENPDGEILYLTKPIMKELAFQLNYTTPEGIYRLNKKHIPLNNHTYWQLEVLKYVFTEYVMVRINKTNVIELIIQARYKLWVRNNFKIIEDETTI